MSALAAARKWLARLAVAVLGLLCLVSLALTLLLGTPWGRGVVLTTTLPIVNRSIPGEVHIDVLRQLDETGLHVENVVVLDPQREEVLRLGRVVVHWDLFEALHTTLLEERGRYVLGAVEIDGGRVDLRQPEDTERGLLAAFVDPSQPKSPEPPAPGPPPYLRIDHFEVRAVDVLLPELPQLGELTLRDLGLAGFFELDGSPRARLARLRAMVERRGEPLGSIESLSAFVGRGPEPSSAALDLRLAGIRLFLEAALVAPPEPGWETRPLKGALSVRDVTAPALARLLQEPALAGEFLGELHFSAEVRGTPAQPRVSSRLETAGGTVGIAATGRDFASAAVTLSTDRLVLGAVRPDLPMEPLTFVLQTNVQRAAEPPGRQARPDDEALALELLLRRATFAGEPLPEVDATARLEGSRLRNLRLRLADGQSRLVVRGDLDLEGPSKLEGAGDLHETTVRRVLALSGLEGNAGAWTHFRFAIERKERGKITSRGELQSDGVHVAGQGFGSARARWDLEADLSAWQDPNRFPKLLGKLDATLEDARWGERTIEAARLELVGTGDAVRLELQGTSQELQARAELRGVSREGVLSVEGTVAGTHDGAAFSAEIGKTNVTRAGDVRTSGIELTVAGQTLRLRGEVTAGTLDVSLDTGPVLLAELTRNLGLEPSVRGTVDVRAKVEGSLDAPTVALQLTGLGLGLEARPELDALFDVRLDARRGKLAFDSSVRTSASTRLTLEAAGHATFRGGKDWLDRLPRGDGAFSVRLGHLDLELVEQWLPDLELPMTGSVRADVRARGTLQEPQLEGHLDADLRRKGGQTPLGVAVGVRLIEDRVNLFGRLSDPEGSLVDLAAEGELPEQGLAGSKDTAWSKDAARSTPNTLDRLAALPAAGQWSVRLLTPERELRKVGFLLDRDDVPALAYSGELHVTHEPHQEPHGSLRVSATQLEAYPETSSCRGGPLRVELGARLREGQLSMEATGASPERRLFDFEARGQVRLAPFLAGATPQLGPMDARLLAERLPLRSVPVLCEQLQGELTARARLKDVLGARPEFDGRLEARGVTLGSPSTLDVAFEARANSERAAVDVQVHAPRATSKARLSVPILWGNGALVVRRDAPLRGNVHLQKLPIAPFTPSDGPVSYATGSVDGTITLRGTLGEPDLDGVVELQDVGFTATDVAQPFHDVTGRFRFTERTLHIEEFRAHDRDGSLGLTGRVTLDGREHVNAAFRVEARRFPVRRLGQVLATADFDADVQTNVVPERTNVQVALEDVHVWIESTEVRRGIELEPHPHFVIDGERPDLEEDDASETPLEGPSADGQRVVVDDRRPPQRSTASGDADANADSKADPDPDSDADETASSRVTRFDVETRGRFWVNRKDFAVKLDADLQGEARGEDTVLRGQVLIERGYVTLLGRVFDLQRDSRLTFVGNSPPDPQLQVSAVHENRRTGRRIELRIGGRASQPELTFLVDGERTEAGGALLAIYGSERTSQDPASAERQAAGFVGGLTAGLLATSARRKLGAAAPILMIDPGQAAGEGRLRAGFELDTLVPQFLRDFITGVYFEGIVAREGAGATASGAGSSGRPQQEARVQGGVLLEFYFPNNFFNTNQYGPGATWSVDVGWQL